MSARPMRAPGYLEALCAGAAALPLRQIRFCALIAALALYGLFGTPTPDAPDWSILAAGILLLLAIDPQAAMNIASLRLSRGSAPWSGPGVFLLLYGITIPCIVAALSGHAPAPILRDLLGFLFLLFPLFYAPLVTGRRQFSFLAGAAILIGLGFSLRALAEPLAALLRLDPLRMLGADPLSYLANAPTVLFTALFLLGTGGSRLIKAQSRRQILIALSLFSLSIIPLAAMALALQRASFGVIALCCAFWLVLAFWRAPIRALRLLLPLGIFSVCAMPFIWQTGAQLAEKTFEVGANMRVEEFSAVWQAVSATPFALLFGAGWGAAFASPAVGGITVNFTHSLISWLVLKTGLAGLILGLIYLTPFGKALLARLRRAPVLALALAGPFAIDIFLYASFKSLDFGLILLLIAASRTASETVNR